MITLCVINSPSSSKRFCYWFLDHREANLAMKAEVDFCLTAAPSAMDSRLRWVQKDSSWSLGGKLRMCHHRDSSVYPKPQTSHEPAISATSHGAAGWVTHPSGSPVLRQV